MSGAAEIFPNLFLIGAMKAGTTSVHQALSEHPQIFMSRVKEPKYFAFQHERRMFSGPLEPDNMRYYTKRERYLRLFRDRGAKKYAGESSALYLYSPEAAKNIYQAAPEARLIAIVRNPVDRAYSQFNGARRRGLEPETSFSRALELEEARIARNWGSSWHYKRRGLYTEQLERYFACFPRRQVFIGVFEDLRSAPEDFYRQIFEFLELPEDVRLNTDRVFNKSMQVRSFFLQKVGLQLRRLAPPRMRARLWNSPVRAWITTCLRPLSNLNLQPTVPLQQELRRQLAEYYAPEIRRLEHMLERNLDGWRSEMTKQ